MPQNTNDPKPIRHKTMTEAERANFEFAVLKWAKNRDDIRTLIDRFLKYSTIVIVVWLIADAFKVTAGKETKLDWLMSLNINQWLGYLLAGICGGGWYRQWNSQKKKSKSKNNEVAELEKRLQDNSNTSKDPKHDTI